MIRLPEHPLPTKPREQEVCNGCGLCCASELCELGKMVFPVAHAPCPAMVFEQGKVRCGFVLTEIAVGLAPLIQRVLDIGGGCSMTDD